jgi:transposase-like protein
MMSFAPPHRIRLFTDNATCLATIEGFRWARGHFCPRCGSRQVRQSRSDGHVHLCQDCNYKFNALAGTVFMGVKLPLTSYLQAFTIYNALGDTLSYRDMSFAIGAASRSTHGIIDRVRSAHRDIRFTTTDRQPGGEPPRGERESQAAASNNFFAFCAMRSILVDEDAFLDYIEAVTNTPTNLVEVYGKRGRPRAPDARLADREK